MDTETKAYLDKICKKQDKILHMLTVVLKAMHLLPINEKEEKAIQLAQRKNATVIAKVNDELNALSKTEPLPDSLGLHNLDVDKDVYNGILGDDILEDK